MDAKLRSLISLVKKEHDDDAVDRAVYATTVYVLSFFAILIMARQYVGEPLQCWLPAEYTGAWESYIENYCFVENTYYVNGTRIPEDRSVRRQYELRYYQWIPYILSLQALLCFAPKLIFKLLYSFSDLRVTDLIQLAYRESKGESGILETTSSIAKKFVLRRTIKAQISFNCYLTMIYLLMKILIIVVLLTQLVIMNYFIASTDIFWGFRVLWQLSKGVDWRITGFFPRVTFCDLQTRDIGQSRQHTVQCVLMINMFAEKIYIFLWIWFFMFLIGTVFNLFFWIYRMLSMPSKVRMVTDALKLHNVHPSHLSVEKFINGFLKFDGVIVLRLMEANAGYLHMSDILYQLWANFFGVEPALGIASPLLSKKTNMPGGNGGPRQITQLSTPTSLDTTLSKSAEGADVHTAEESDANNEEDDDFVEKARL